MFKLKKTKVLRNGKPVKKPVAKAKPKLKKVEEKEGNYLYKFSFYDYEKDNVKNFLNCFDSLSASVSFIDNILSTAIDNYQVIKTIYYNQAEEDKYSSDEEIDDVSENFKPLFDEEDFFEARNADEFKKLLVDTKKKVSTTYLAKYKNTIKDEVDYNKKLTAFINVLKDSNFYIIQNKETLKNIDVTKEFMLSIINENEVRSDKFKTNKKVFHKILEYFNETERVKKANNNNEINFINKAVSLTCNKQKVVIEESKKKTILENGMNKFTFNFISFRTAKKLKKKSLQIFEMLNDENKIKLIDCLKI